MKKRIILVLFPVYMLLGCGKSYDDGPILSFRTAKSRILGMWQVESAEVNPQWTDFDECIDSTSQDLIMTNYFVENIIVYEFKRNNEFVIYRPFPTVLETGIWEFSADRESIELSGNWTNVYSWSNFGLEVDKLDLNRLTNQDLSFVAFGDYRCWMTGQTLSAAISMDLKKVK